MSELKRATSLGSGTMGPGMGVVLARAGLQVTVYDTRPEALERAEGMVGVVEGVLDRLEVPVRDGGGVSFESDLETALEGCEIVAEAIPERLELKQEVLAEVERHISAETIVASNTSGIPITAIAA